MEEKKRDELEEVNMRDEKLEKQLKPRLIKNDDIPLDYYVMIGMVLGMVGLLLRFKVFCWLALICAMGSIFNLKKGFIDYKNLVTSVIFGLMGLFLSYFGPPSPWNQIKK